MLTQKQLNDLEEYIKLHLHVPVLYEANYYSAKESFELIDLEKFMEEKRKPTLQELLFRYIDERGEKDADVYKRAGIDRRHFSKIRSKTDYKPSKNTVISLSLALELTTDQAEELLSTAGFSLSESDTFDLVIQYCLEHSIYPIHDVNQALTSFSLKPLGGVLI